MAPGIIVCFCIACFLLGGLIGMVITAVLAAVSYGEKCSTCKYRRYFNGKKEMPIQETTPSNPNDCGWVD